MGRVTWDPVIEKAAQIVRSYDTPVTLRQLFYRLVSAEILPNTTSYYQTLSKKSAQARREGWFPDLTDRTRDIHRPFYFNGLSDARSWIKNKYRLDRTSGQDWSIYLGVEKNGMINQLTRWFDRLGLPVLAMGGYASQSYIDDIRYDVLSHSRPAVLIYAGDFDPSGEDILRDLLDRLNGCFQQVEKIALTPQQIDDYDLPPQMGKARDPRAADFMARHGELIQVELDALPPETLRELYQEAIDKYYDNAQFEQVMQQERKDLERLTSDDPGI